MSDNLDWIFDDDNISQTNTTISSRMERAVLKRTRIQALQHKSASSFLKTLPKSGESYHIISNGNFDYFTFVPIVINLLGNYSAEYYGSTWTMNRGNVIDLLELFDSGKLGSINILTGLYFKQRESAVYATLYNGIQERKQRYKALKNHAKIMLMRHHGNYIVMEGSANFTANPRIEQTTIINDEELYNFHKDWMLEVFNG